MYIYIYVYIYIYIYVYIYIYILIYLYLCILTCDLFRYRTILSSSISSRRNTAPRSCASRVSRPRSPLCSAKQHRYAIYSIYMYMYMYVYMYIYGCMYKLLNIFLYIKIRVSPPRSPSCSVKRHRYIYICV